VTVALSVDFDFSHVPEQAPATAQVYQVVSILQILFDSQAIFDIDYDTPQGLELS
jgi:hypothetical protein